MPSNPSAAEPSAPIFFAREILCHPPIVEGGELLARLVGLIAEHHSIGDPTKALQAVMAREEESPTFIASRVALPHARLDGIDETFLAVATSKEGFHFKGVDNTARLVVLMLTPACAPAAYLRAAASVARRLQDPNFLDQVVDATNPDTVFSLFHPDDRGLSGIICAADMMAPPTVVLRETSSIKDAIDLIVRTGQTEIPVVDKEGMLVGEASADEVLSLCIPDYLLWMEDLSGFSNFEPFAALLRKESSTWMADIMSDDYASVSADQPAIAVAEALARKDAGICYVLDGGRLVGVVTLPNFLNKVFRD